MVLRTLDRLKSHAIIVVQDFTWFSHSKIVSSNSFGMQGFRCALCVRWCSSWKFRVVTIGELLLLLFIYHRRVCIRLKSFNCIWKFDIGTLDVIQNHLCCRCLISFVLEKKKMFHTLGVDYGWSDVPECRFLCSIPKFFMAKK